MSGKLGLEGGVTSSVSPKLIESIEGLRTIKVSAGNGHLCFVVDTPADDDKNGKAALDVFPVLQELGPLVTTASKVDGGAKKKGALLSAKGNGIPDVKKQKKV